MKKPLHKIILLIIMFSFSNNLLSQINLVTNPSFEDTIACPNNENQIDYATGWSSCGDTPDYFNSCNSLVLDFSVPNNWGGYQQAATGMAYCAVGSGYGGNFTNIREFIISKLITPLTIGEKYFVSFKTSLSLSEAIYANTATNRLGILFSTIAYNASTPAPITNFAHIYSNNIINDTTNWTSINGIVTADSAYQYIMIGNFFDDSNTDTLIYIQDNFAQGSYYFIDDVSVMKDTTNNTLENTDSKNYFSAHFNTDYLIINFIENFEFINNNYELEIFNLLGQKIYCKKIHDNITRINFSSLSNGLYVLNLKSECKNFTKKIFFIN